MNSESSDSFEGYPSSGSSFDDKEHELYTETEELMFGSKNLQLDENHIGELVGICNIFSADKCGSCDSLAEECKNLETIAQTQLYHLSVAKATNKLLKSKLTELEGRLSGGGVAMANLKAELDSLEKEKLELEERLKRQTAPVQAEVISTTTHDTVTSISGHGGFENHGVDKTKRSQGDLYVCMCGAAYPDALSLYAHFKYALSSKKTPNANVACSLCKQKFISWLGLINHCKNLHLKTLEDILLVDGQI